MDENHHNSMDEFSRMVTEAYLGRVRQEAAERGISVEDVMEHHLHHDVCDLPHDPDMKTGRVVRPPVRSDWWLRSNE